MRIGSSRQHRRCRALSYPASRRAAGTGMDGGTAPMVEPPADPFGRNGTGRRLAELVRQRPDEHSIAWTRAWMSRDGRWNWLLAARHRDFVVLTDRRLLLCSCGFFTRRPRRCVFDETLRAVERGRHRRSRRTARRHLRLSGWRGRPLRLDFGRHAASRASRPSSSDAPVRHRRTRQAARRVHVRRDRDRRRDDRRARVRRRRARHAACDGRIASSRSTSRSRAGSSTTPTTSGASPSRRSAEVAARDRRAWARPSPRSASRTNARRRSSGTGARVRRCHRAIVWQDRRTAERCDALRAAGHEPLIRRHDRARARPVLLGDEARVVAARGRRARRRRPRVRHGRHVDPVAPHRRRRRRRARDRSVEREPHDALRHRRARVVRRAVRAVRRAARVPARGAARRADASARRAPDCAAGSRCRSAASPATSRPRCSGRRASSRA